MASHIVISALVCASVCQPVDIRVWDGDSLRLGMTSEAEAIRIYNIDTPELDGQCAYELDLAQKAKQGLASILDGARIEIHRVDEDRYGRTLAVIQANGADVGDEMVRRGLARTWMGRREPWC